MYVCIYDMCMCMHLFIYLFLYICMYVCIYKMYVCMTYCRQVNFEVLNLGKVQEFITMGKLVPQPNQMLTMRDLLESGVITQVREGIKLLANVRTYVFMHAYNICVDIA